jgi:HAD superfamily hydrolase (TIGR01509 family)
MFKAVVSDFSRVLLFPKDKNYSGSLNALHKELSQQEGYNPLDHFELNTQLLDLYKSLKEKTPIYIFTSDAIQDAPEFKQYLDPVFAGILSDKKMNTDKKIPEAYKLFAAQLQLSPDEILYIDDANENIEAAKTAGLHTFLYAGYEELSQQITESLNY